MAKLSSEITATVNHLKQQSLNVIDEATAVELLLFEQFGETEETLLFFNDLTTVAEDATSSFSQLSTLQLNIARTQPTAPCDLLNLLTQAIKRTQARIPAWYRSIEEVKNEWNLP